MGVKFPPPLTNERYLDVPTKRVKAEKPRNNIYLEKRRNLRFAKALINSGAT